MKRTGFIAILLALLCAAVIYAWVATPQQRSITGGEKVSRSVTTAPEFNREPLHTVADLNFSSGQTDGFHPPEVNLFGPLYRSRKAEKPRSLAVTVKTDQPVIPPPFEKIEPEVLVPRELEPIQPLNVLGFLLKAGQTTVFLASTKGEVYLVKEADVFADDLVVDQIVANEIRIRRKNTAQQVSLRLDEARSQRLPGLKLVSDRPQFTPQETADSVNEPGDGKSQKVLKNEPENTE